MICERKVRIILKKTHRFRWQRDHKRMRTTRRPTNATKWHPRLGDIIPFEMSCTIVHWCKLQNNLFDLSTAFIFCSMTNLIFVYIHTHTLTIISIINIIPTTGKQMAFWASWRKFVPEISSTSPAPTATGGWQCNTAQGCVSNWNSAYLSRSLLWRLNLRCFPEPAKDAQWGPSYYHIDWWRWCLFRCTWKHHGNSLQHYNELMFQTLYHNQRFVLLSQARAKTYMFKHASSQK